MTMTTDTAGNRTRPDERDERDESWDSRTTDEPRKTHTWKSFSDDILVVILVTSAGLGVWLGIENLLARNLDTGIEAPALLASLLLVAQPVLTLIRMREQKHAVSKHVNPVMPVLLIGLAVWLGLSDLHGSAPERLTYVALASTFVLFVLGWWLLNDRT